MSVAISGARLKTSAALFLFTLCVIAGALTAGYAASFRTAGRAAHDGEDEVTLTLTADGFAPVQLTRPAGRFMLSVENRTDAKALTLKLSDGGGAVVREIRVRENTTDWSEELNLTAGQYTLAEETHPQRACQMTIQ